MDHGLQHDLQESMAEALELEIGVHLAQVRRVGLTARVDLADCLDFNVHEVGRAGGHRVPGDHLHDGGETAPLEAEEESPLRSHIGIVEANDVGLGTCRLLILQAVDRERIKGAPLEIVELDAVVPGHLLDVCVDEPALRGVLVQCGPCRVLHEVLVVLPGRVRVGARHGVVVLHD